MATSWKSQQGDGMYSLQFETDDIDKYKLVEKASQMAIDGIADVAEVRHGEWELKSEIRRFYEEIDEEFYVECPFCHRGYYVPFEFEDEKMLKYAKEEYPYCHCGAKMDGGESNDL